MADTVEVQGRTLTFPIQVRAASSWAATYLVDLDAARALIGHTGLEPATAKRGKGMLVLPFVRYIDSDLDRYNECGVGVVVRHPGAPERNTVGRMLEAGKGQAGVYIHHLPVDQEFTLAAGRQIWGYPKFMADVHITDEGSSTVCSVRADGRDLLELRVRNGHQFRIPPRALPTYTYMDGVLRRTRWDMPSQIGARIGGAEITLGDHAISGELASLGLPKKAAMTQTIPSMRASFGPAAPVEH